MLSKPFPELRGMHLVLFPHDHTIGFMGAQRLPEDANARGTVPFDTFDTIARASDQWAR